MKVLVSICCFIFCFEAFAESTFPVGCYPLPIKGELVTLKSKKSKLFFIHNLTNADLWITHPVSNEGVSAGWTSRLQADNWSALTVEKSPFTLSCIESKPGHEQQIACEGAIAVCQWKDIKGSAEPKGSYWVSEDMSLASLGAAVGNRGFNLPQPK